MLAIIIQHKHGKVWQPETLVFLESIHKMYFNVLNLGILFKSMINNYKFFDFIVCYQRNICFNMQVYFFEMQVQKVHVTFLQISVTST